MDALEQRYRTLLADLAQEIPGFRLLDKNESTLQRVIHTLLTIVTLGAQSRYLTGYQTTIGRTVYVTHHFHELPASERLIILRHERVHLRQFQRYTLPGMAILYLLVPLPVGLAWFRAHFEKAGYEETIRAAAEIHGHEYVRRPAFREHVLAQFTSGAYGWMWPFRRGLERWYDSVLMQLGRN